MMPGPWSRQSGLTSSGGRTTSRPVRGAAARSPSSHFRTIAPALRLAALSGLEHRRVVRAPRRGHPGAGRGRALAANPGAGRGGVERSVRASKAVCDPAHEEKDTPHSGEAVMLARRVCLARPRACKPTAAGIFDGSERPRVTCESLARVLGGTVIARFALSRGSSGYGPVAPELWKGGPYVPRSPVPAPPDSLPGAHLGRSRRRGAPRHLPRPHRYGDGRGERNCDPRGQRSY